MVISLLVQRELELKFIALSFLRVYEKQELVLLLKVEDTKIRLCLGLPVGHELCCKE